MNNFSKKIIFPEISDLIAPLKDEKYAIYSVTDKKFITDFIFDNISYIPNLDYFIAEKGKKNILIDTLGQIINTIYFNKEDTGLAMNVILISTNLGKNKNQIPYIFIQNDYEIKQFPNWIKIRLDGTVLGNIKPIFDNEVEMLELRNWLEINKLLILMYWTHVETDTSKLSKFMKTLKVIKPLFYKKFSNDWGNIKIIHAKTLEEYFCNLKDKIIGKPLDKIFYTGNLYNYYWNEYCEYKNNE